MSEQSQKNPVLKINLNTTGQVLYFFGAKHSNDPRDSQFDSLKETFDDFIRIAKGEKVIFVEGPIHEIPQDYEVAIREQGETGAAQWLGRKAEIEIVRPEPNEKEQRQALCASFDPHTVAYGMITQNLGAWFRHSRQSSFEDALNRTLSREIKFSEVYGFAPSIDWLYEQHKKLFPDQPLEDKNFLDSISDPRKNDTQVNIIIAARSKIRNEYIFSKIAETWKSGKSIFIVYGRGHLNTLESLFPTLS